MSDASDKIRKRANEIYFSHRNDGDSCKSRITETQCQSVIEAWIREVMPWWFEDDK